MKPPADNAARFGGGNIYTNNPDPKKAVAIAAATGALSWGWSEGGKAERAVEAQRGYDAIVPVGVNGGADAQKDARDCLMMVRKSVHVRHHQMTQVCDDLGDSKIGHARRFAMVGIDVPVLDDTVAHIAVHPNWVQGIDDPGHPVVREMLESLRGLDAMLSFAKAMGWLRVVSGDFNVTRGEEKRYKTIYDVIHDHGLSVKADRLDAVAYDRRLVLDNWHVIPRAKTGSDKHDWTVADLRRKR